MEELPVFVSVQMVKVSVEWLRYQYADDENPKLYVWEFWVHPESKLWTLRQQWAEDQEIAARRDLRQVTQASAELKKLRKEHETFDMESPAWARHGLQELASLCDG